MKTIEAKLIILILCCVIACSALVGGIAISFSQSVADSDSQQIMTLMCDKYTEELDALMVCVEQSVDTLALYVESELESVERLSDEEYLELYTEKLQSAALNCVYSTKGALTVYIRFEPELTHPTSGLYWGREGDENELQQLPTTDLSAYDRSDKWVEWYYLPMDQGTPAWIAPYRNQPMNMLVISYIVPVYKNGVPIGIVGMDIDCGELEHLVESIAVYKSGHAFLLDVTAGLSYHPQHGEKEWHQGISDDMLAAIQKADAEDPGSNALIPYVSNGTDVYMSVRELHNGMHLVVCTPVREINAQRNTMIARILLITIPAMAVVFVAALFFARRTIAPLKKLGEAAYKVAGGTLDVTLPPASEDEVGMLSLAFQEMLLHLRWHNNQMQALAYKDALTGIKNKAAWDDASGRLMREIDSGSPMFAVAVFDVNDLKMTNDTWGHEAGDELLKKACSAICRYYAHSPVFRIGGDEFAAILEGQDYKNREDILTRFRAEFARPDGEMRVASGMSDYIPGSDSTFSDVFCRADDAMYENKRWIKEQQACC